MKVNIESIKFDADRRLLEFIEKKLEKLDRFYERITVADVFLKVDSDQPENKLAQIRMRLPGGELFVEKKCKSFEEAIDLCIEALKKQLDKTKEKIRG